jgi:glycerol-3-phosphate dehydrogenase
VTANPIPTEKDISWILKEIQNYLNNDIKVRRGDVLSAWSGIRPLVRDPNAKDTSALVRNHMIHVSSSGLLTIAGGKWTTYRAMAEETIDKAIEVFSKSVHKRLTKLGLSPSGPCITSQIPLIGSHNWSRNMFLRLIQHFGLDTEVAEHLCSNYGDRAWIVASYATYTNQPWPIYGKKLDEHYPFIEGEVRYACHHEYACNAIDVLARRTRLAFLNARAALDAAPRVIDIMAEELGWDRQKQKEELQNVREFLKTMGLFPSAPGELLYSQHCFRPEELNRFKAEFVAIDKDHDGIISKSDAEKLLGKLGFTCTAEEWKQVYHESRLKAFKTFEYNRFLELVASVKEMKDRARFALIVQEIRDAESPSTDRSGGGI